MTQPPHRSRYQSGWPTPASCSCDLTPGWARHRGPRLSVRASEHPREDRRRAGGVAAPVPPGQSVCGQGPHPGRQPAGRRHHHHQPRTARHPDGYDLRRADPPLRRPTPSGADRHGHRGPLHAAPASPAHPALTTEERELQRHITAVLRTHAPQLLQRHGIGPDSASALHRDEKSGPPHCLEQCGGRPHVANLGEAAAGANQESGIESSGNASHTRLPRGSGPPAASVTTSDQLRCVDVTGLFH